MDVIYQEAREHDNLKEGRATKRRRRDDPMVSTKEFNKAVESSVELFVGREVLRARLIWVSCFGFGCCLGRFLFYCLCHLVFLLS